jgi:hypothetical protein
MCALFASKKSSPPPVEVDKPLLLNEAFHEPLRCIFIAIPKTGTTSIRTQLQQTGKFLIPNPHLSILQVRDCIYPYYLQRSLGKNLSFPTQPLIDDATIRNKAASDFESFFKFSTVRNPWARAVSLYFRKEGKSPSEIMDFESFCDQHFYASDTCKHPTLHRNQYDWLCDESGKPLMDYVGKLESISEALEEIARRTNNRLGLKFQHENQNQRSPASSYRDVYNERTKKIIAQRFEKDIDYFKYTF